jgi:hypothetical protein
MPENEPYISALTSYQNIISGNSLGGVHAQGGGNGMIH